MYSLLAYILQVNILLAIVYIGYYVLLKKLTFYNVNRGYFLAGVVFAFVYPFLDIKSLFQKHIEPVGEWMAYLPEIYTQQVEKSVYTLENVIYMAIGLVGLWFGVRLSIRLLSLLRIHYHSQKTVWKTYWYQNVLFPVVPFSFLNKIYVHKEQHQEPELYDIFEHEDIHVKGMHSMDILLFEILLIVCWYNPFVWLMRKAVRQNLEYLTDQQVLNKGVDRQAYQYSLLQVSKQGTSLGLSNQFNFKFLKKRIMMMNKKKSSKLELSKYAFLLPIVIFSAGAFTISKADSQITDVAEMVKDVRFDIVQSEVESNTEHDDQQQKETAASGQMQEKRLIIVDGKRMLPGYDLDEVNPDDVESVSILKAGAALTAYGAEAVHGVVEITTKAHANDTTKNAASVEESKGFQIVGHRDEQNVSDTTDKSRVELRGTVELRGVKPGTEPLYVIDGVISKKGQPALDALDPNQIETITVLQDTSATALYGDEGKNGVILVVTKK